MGKQSSGWKKSPMNNTGPNDQSPDIEPKRSFGQKLIAQFREVFGMFLYLWALFALFTYHKAIVLVQHMYRNPVYRSVCGFSKFFSPFVISFVGDAYPVYSTQYNRFLIVNKNYHSPCRKRINY